MKKMLFAGVMLATASAVFGQELVVNGGFEAGTTSPPAGWAGIQGGASGVNVGGTFGSPHSGTNWYAMGATSAASQTDLTQSIATTIGTTYAVSFWAKDSDPNLSGNLLVTFGGTQVGPTTLVPNVYTQYSANVVATGTSTVLEFKGWETLDYVLVDDFSVQAQAVPEPASMAALGLGVLALVRRRRTPKA